jgi:hypothetical protein
MNLARVVYVLTIWVLVAGTLVTAAGPHGGDAEARRLGWPLGDVARIHAVSVDVLVVVTLFLVVALMRTPAPRRALNTASVTIAVMVAQGLLGYVQYFNRIPPVLVGFHVFGAVCVFICVQQLLLELRVTDAPVGSLEREASAPAGISMRPAWKSARPGRSCRRCSPCSKRARRTSVSPRITSSSRSATICGTRTKTVRVSTRC